MVLSYIQYALPVYSGNLLQSDIEWINAALRKARRWGLPNIQTDFDTLARRAGITLFNEVLKFRPQQAFPPKKNNVIHNLRSNNILYSLDLQLCSG